MRSATATDAIEAAVMIMDGTSRQGQSKPGWAVGRLGFETREALRELTSDSVDLQSFGPLQRRLVSYGLTKAPRWGRRSKRWS